MESSTSSECSLPDSRPTSAMPTPPPEWLRQLLQWQQGSPLKGAYGDHTFVFRTPPVGPDNEQYVVKAHCKAQLRAFDWVERMVRAEVSFHDVFRGRLPPGIVPLTGCYEDEAFIYLVFPYAGRPLLNHVRKPTDPASHKLSALLAQEVAYQLILTWGWMHTQDLVYLDGKPDQVVLQFDNLARRVLPRLVDMGSVDDTGCCHASTPGYVPPEKHYLGGNAAATPKWDAYAVAVIFGEVLTGCVPGDPTSGAGDGPEVTEEELIADFPSIFMSRSAWRSLPPSCSDLKALIARLAHPDPARRPTLEEARRSPAFAQLEREAGERQRELWVLMAGREDMLEACAAQEAEAEELRAELAQRDEAAAALKRQVANKESVMRQMLGQSQRQQQEIEQLRDQQRALQAQVQQLEGEVRAREDAARLADAECDELRHEVALKCQGARQVRDCLVMSVDETQAARREAAALQGRVGRLQACLGTVQGALRALRQECAAADSQASATDSDTGGDSWSDGNSVRAALQSSGGAAASSSCISRAGSCAGDAAMLEAATAVLVGGQQVAAAECSSSMGDRMDGQSQGADTASAACALDCSVVIVRAGSPVTGGTKVAAGTPWGCDSSRGGSCRWDSGVTVGGAFDSSVAAPASGKGLAPGVVARAAWCGQVRSKARQAKAALRRGVFAPLCFVPGEVDRF